MRYHPMAARHGHFRSWTHSILSGATVEAERVASLLQDAVAPQCAVLRLERRSRIVLDDDELVCGCSQGRERGFVFLFHLIRRIEEYDVCGHALQYGDRLACINFGARL